MKITGINGSIRQGNCHLALEIFLDVAQSQGAETSLIDLGSQELAPCQGVCHHHCHPLDDQGKLVPGGWHQCTRNDDGANILQQLVESDGIVLASPVLFGNLSALCKTLMERSNALASFATGPNTSFLAGKWGAAIAVGGARHNGQEIALQSMVNFFMAVQMFPVGLGEYQAPLGLSLVGDQSGSILNDRWTDYEIKEAHSVAYLEAYGRKLAGLCAQGGPHV